MDLAVVMVTFFQNTTSGLSLLFHTGEEINKQGSLHPEGSQERKTSLASILIRVPVL